MNKRFFLLLTPFTFLISLYGDAYYKKGTLTELTNKSNSGKYLSYTDENSNKLTISSTLILKTTHSYESRYFESKYGIVLTKKFGKVMIFEVKNIDSVVPLCK